MILLGLAVFLGLALWGLDRHICLKDAGKDLRLHLADMERALNLAPTGLKVHYQAYIIALKRLIEKHF